MIVFRKNGCYYDLDISTLNVTVRDYVPYIHKTHIHACISIHPYLPSEGGRPR